MRAVALVSTLALVFCGCSSKSSSTPAADPDAGTTATDGAAPPAARKALGMNDVSVLIPIPSSPAAEGSLGATDAGDRGELLPQAVYDKIPKFGVKPAEGLDYARMRAVAIRFDGCFPMPAGCEPQIRIVMQPITDAGTTLDSALHLFYRLGEAELGQVVTRLRELRALAPEQKDAPLDVSPALLAQGMTGPYGAGLRELVLKFAGEQNLVRMTFFLRAPPRQEEWFFGGFNRSGDTMTSLDIVGVGKGNQRVDRPLVQDGYKYEFTPAAKGPEDVSVLLSTESAAAATPEARDAALASFARIANPDKYGPDALPCAGCHVVSYVAAATKEKYAQDLATQPDAFKSGRDLTLRGQAVLTPSSLRALGWFKDQPMISVRVVNETAAVLDDLDKRFPLQ